MKDVDLCEYTPTIGDEIVVPILHYDKIVWNKMNVKNLIKNIGIAFIIEYDAGANVRNHKTNIDNNNSNMGNTIINGSGNSNGSGKPDSKDNSVGNNTTRNNTTRNKIKNIMYGSPCFMFNKLVGIHCGVENGISGLAQMISFPMAMYSEEYIEWLHNEYETNSPIISESKKDCIDIKNLTTTNGEVLKSLKQTPVNLGDFKATGNDSVGARSEYGLHGIISATVNHPGSANSESLSRILKPSVLDLGSLRPSG